jgi:plastocyanin
MNSKYLLGGLALLIIVVVGGFLFLNNKTNYQKTTQQANSPQPTQSEQVKNTTVTITNSGFDPAVVNIKTGTTVVWMNKSGQNATVNSDIYPNNLLWSFLNLGEFDNNSNVSVVFEKSGKYTYHNQLNPDQKGTVVVQ